MRHDECRTSVRTRTTRGDAVEVTITVNGTTQSHDVEPRTLLVHYVREHAGLTGTNVGCDTSSCGACTIHLNGEAVKSCTVLAVQADGADIVTIEGLGRRRRAAPDAAGVHGEPRPAVRLLHAGHGHGGDAACSNENPHPTEQDVRLGLEGNLCRCTGYHNIVKSVLAARRQPMQERRHDPCSIRLRPCRSAEEAISLIGEHGDDAKFLAGGHSLLPLMKLRLAQPTRARRHRSPHRPVVHPRRRRPHRHRRPDPPHGRRDLRAARTSTSRCCAHAAGHVGDPQVRHRGTIGGSIAHADPASDLPATTLALGATYVAQGPNGTREIAAADFYKAFLESALAPDEMLTEIRVPKMQRRRVELPEVQPPRPGLGDRRRRRVAPQRRRRRGARQHGLDARSWPPACRPRCRAVRRSTTPPSWPPPRRRRRPTSTPASSTASTSPRSSRGAPSKPPRAEPRPERRVNTRPAEVDDR